MHNRATDCRATQGRVIINYHTSVNEYHMYLQRWWEGHTAAKGRLKTQETYQVRIDLDRGCPQPAVLQHTPNAADGNALSQATHNAPRDHDVLHRLERIITAIRRSRRNSSSAATAAGGVCVGH